jgi:hypothetical protein
MNINVLVAFRYWLVFPFRYLTVVPINNINQNENMHYCTARESHIYPSPDFSFVLGILPPVQIRTFVPVGATNRYKCPLTEPRHGLTQPNRSKSLTFVPGEDTTWYKCMHICTGPCLGLVQMCNAIIPPPPPRPSPLLTLLLPISNLSSPSPMAP